jgi:hypothetical protein
MTPEQRLDRVERILVLFVSAGRRVRGEYRQQSHEQDEKINMLIQTQMETEEIMKRLAVSQTQLAESQKRTDKALRAFINTHRKSENGQS